MARIPDTEIGRRARTCGTASAAGVGGGPIDWVMKWRGVSFRHAVELLRESVVPLAADAGVLNNPRLRVLPPPVAFDADDRALLSQTVDYYHQRLLATSEAAAYLKARGLVHPELIATLKLELHAGLRDKARRALSPPVLGSRCGVNCCAIQHNGLLIEAAPFARKLARRGGRFAPFGFDQPPVMSGAPQRLRHCISCGWRRRSSSQARQAAQNDESAPPGHPSAPERLPAPSTGRPSVAPCPPRQGFASPLRALDPAARGAR